MLNNEIPPQPPSPIQDAIGQVNGIIQAMQQQSQELLPQIELIRNILGELQSGKIKPENAAETVQRAKDISKSEHDH